jgi:hypothetical protein
MTTLLEKQSEPGLKSVVQVAMQQEPPESIIAATISLKVSCCPKVHRSPGLMLLLDVEGGGKS